ncbi:hypothetical protein BT69DRAFT_456988 [Atractiella rhizophila]|nr:hypothetical protein BT69DRAFT_456988 [Atractiella rhizophila]
MVGLRREKLVVPVVGTTRGSESVVVASLPSSVKSPCLAPLVSSRLFPSSVCCGCVTFSVALGDSSEDVVGSLSAEDVVGLGLLSLLLSVTVLVLVLVSVCCASEEVSAVVAASVAEVVVLSVGVAPLSLVVEAASPVGLSAFGEEPLVLF